MDLLGVLVTYAIELIVRLGRTVVSSNWKLVTATIAGTLFRENRVWDCPTVDIVYTYQIYGQTYGGTDRRSYFFSIFAEQDAKRFKRGETVVVRVDPHEPQRSMLRRADQANLAKAAD